MPITWLLILSLAAPSWAVLPKSIVLPANRVPPPPGQLRSYSCTVDSDEGLCYMDSTGNIVSWIVQAWDSGRPVGHVKRRYVALYQKQRQYNEWLKRIKSHVVTYVSKSGSNRLTDKDFTNVQGLSIRSFGEVWTDTDVQIADGIDDSGQATIATFLIPFYRSAAEIAAGWRRLEISCQYVQLARINSDDRAQCVGLIQSYDPDQWRGKTDVALEMWADRLHAAYEASRELQEEILKQDFTTFRSWKEEDVTPETVPADFFKQYQAALAKIEADLDDARLAEGWVRKGYLK